MDSDREAEYAQHRGVIGFLIRKGEIENIKIDHSNGLTCYFCSQKIKGRTELVLYDTGEKKEPYHLHPRCYGSALLGEMDFFD